MLRRFVVKKMRVCFSYFLFLIIITMGCFLNSCAPQWSGSGFVRKEFLEYNSVAVLPFKGDDSGEVSRAFAWNFYEKFPQISIVDRKRVLEFFRDQPLPSDPLDEETRLRIGNHLNAKALITGNIYYPSITRWLLQIMILDTETGKVMGRSLVEINFRGAMGKEAAARFAVEKLTPW
jgi:hypothetical protein